MSFQCSTLCWCSPIYNINRCIILEQFVKMGKIGKKWVKTCKSRNFSLMHSNVRAIEFQRNLPVSWKNVIKTVKNDDLHARDIINVNG